MARTKEYLSNIARFGVCHDSNNWGSADFLKAVPSYVSAVLTNFYLEFPRMIIERDDCLLLQTAIYPREAILRASYWMDGELAVSLSQLEGGALQVTLRPKGGGDIHALREKFQAAVIDFAIRVDVEHKTAELRNRIWQIAFAEAGMRKPEGR